MTAPGPQTPATPPQAVSGSDSRPEPVRNAAAVASAVTTAVGLVLTVLVVTHVLTPAGGAILGPALASAVPTVVGAVSTIVAALHARGQVTPLSAPVSAAGLALIETGQAVAGAVEQAVKLGPPRRPGPQTPGQPDHLAP